MRRRDFIRVTGTGWRDHFTTNQELLLTGMLLMVACYGQGRFGAAGVVVGPARTRRGAPARAGGRRAGPRRLARRSSRRSRAARRPSHSGSSSIRSTLALGGRLGRTSLLVIFLVAIAAATYGPAYLRSRTHPTRDLRALRRRLSRSTCFWVAWRFSLLLRRRCLDIPPLLGRNDTRQLHPGCFGRRRWRECAGRTPLYGDDSRGTALLLVMSTLTERLGP